MSLGGLAASTHVIFLSILEMVLFVNTVLLVV
jgi:hypothetical protein